MKISFILLPIVALCYAPTLLSDTTNTCKVKACQQNIAPLNYLHQRKIRRSKPSTGYKCVSSEGNISYQSSACPSWIAIRKVASNS